jgi:hypothetical protein
MRTPVVLDAAALELILHEMLLAALQESSAGEELHLHFGEVRDGHASVMLHCVPPRQVVSDGAARQRLMALAARMRGAVEEAGQLLTLQIPGQPGDAALVAGTIAPAAPSVGADVPAVADRPSGGRESGHDVRSAREREHGQSGAL